MIKRILGGLVFLLAMNAGVRVAFVNFNHQQFKDALTELSLFSGTKSEELVRASVMQLAAEHKIPLDPDFIEISRKNVPGIGDHSAIKVSYAVNVSLLPGAKPRRFEFDYSTR